MPSTACSSRAVIALSPREVQQFFGGPTGGLDRLRQLLPDAQWADPGAIGARWSAYLSAERPEILVSGWSTPALPGPDTSIRYLCHLGGSVRHLIGPEHFAGGLTVTNWGTSVSETVAEAALLLALAALRRSRHYGEVMQRQRSWAYLPGGCRSLFDRAVGFHGFGTIARELVGLLRPFRCPIVAYAPGVPDGDLAAYNVGRADSLEELFRRSAVLFELAALTSETRGAVSGSILELLPPNAVFVNVARGAIVDEAALTRLAQAGRIAVGLDVYASDPLAADSPLRDLSEAILFPHLAGPTDDRIHLCGDAALDNLGRYLAGLPLQGVVTREVFDRSS